MYVIEKPHALLAYNLFLMQAPTHILTHAHTWHYVCLNNHFLMQCAWLLRVWLEPLGDLSVWAMQAGNPSKFALGSGGTRTRTPEFLALVCTLLHPPDPSPCCCIKWYELDCKMLPTKTLFSVEYLLSYTIHFGEAVFSFYVPYVCVEHLFQF